MANPSIISTKINIPRARIDVVMRPRVMKILDEGLERPSALMLISAPAGYGKTTLVISWLRTINQRYAWLSLDVEDDSLPRFVAYLLAALQKIDSAIGWTAQRTLESSSTKIFPTDTIISSLIRDLSDFAEPIILVLEDYHCMESRAVHDFVETIIEQVHPPLRVLITTRKDPPLSLARWRVRNQLTELHTTDLQFTLDETTEFLQRVMKLELSQQNIHLLGARTEGWVAGLQLAALSIQNHQNESGAWSIAGSRRDIAGYLISEVVGQLPQERKEFLLQTSLVDRLSATLCDTITGRNNSQTLLEGLEADNLFILALDDDREWFRYHHLFAEFLRKRLLAEYSEDMVKELHQRASHWFAEHADILSAIEHALAAKDYEYAACLIAPQSQQWMQRGEISTIIKYLNQLPKDQVWNDWSLCLWYGWSYAVSGDLSHAELWANRLDTLITPLIQDATLKENGSIPSELQNAYVQLLAIRSVTAHQNKDFASAIALDEQALRLVPQDNLNLHTIISALLSSAVLEAGRFDQAESLLHSTRKSAYRTDNPFITFTLLLNESALAVMRGQLQRAHDLNEEALRLAQAESMERLAFLPQFRLGRINYFWNQLAQAKQYVTTAIEHADVEAYPYPTVRGYITLACIQNAEGQYPQALQTLEHAGRLALHRKELESAEMVRGVRAQLQFSAGENEEVARWVKSSDWESFSSSKPGLILSDESFFPYCQVLIASGQSSEWKRIEHLLEWRLTDSERQRRNSTILKIRLMQAFLHHTKNQPNFAMASLLQALEIAMPENCIRPFLDEGQPLIPYLRRVPPRHAARGFAQKILAYISTPHMSSQLFEPLSRQELNILQLIAQGHTNPEIAVKLVLAVSTVRWYAKQIFRKLGVHNRTQAATQAKKLNLI
jgi:LuxR family maltose regulon positive regulatory protein